MDVNQLLWNLAGSLGLAPGNLAIILGIIVFAANTTSRMIPDTAVGWQGQVRRVASWIGLHIRNNSGTAPVATNVDGVVIPTEATKVAGAPAASVTDLVDPEALTAPTPIVKDPFGNGAKALSMIAMMLVVFPVLMTLQACAATDDNHIATSICSHQVAIRISANAALVAAVAIKDDTARQIAIDSANASLAAISVCPTGNTQPVPANAVAPNQNGAQ